jgi:hypothetical protein
MERRHEVRGLLYRLRSRSGRIDSLAPIFGRIFDLRAFINRNPEALRELRRVVAFLFPKVDQIVKLPNVLRAVHKSSCTLEQCGQVCSQLVDKSIVMTAELDMV